VGRELYAALDADAGNHQIHLSSLLSQFLVAFTIELDNEFERRMPHSTTNHGSTGAGPWLVSMAMWFTCMRFVTEEGITKRELVMRARADTNLNGMKRWGYITIADSVIRPTVWGVRAREIWPSLFGIVESRWRERFGESEIEELRAALLTVAGRLNPDLPDCMPILGYGLFSRLPQRVRPSVLSSDAPLPVLLAKVLLAFTIEFERDSEVSLAICANVLRHEGAAVKDLPRIAGVSREAIAMAVGFLERHGFARKAKVLELTARGRSARDAYSERAQGGEPALREMLERLAPGLGRIDLWSEGWRASVRKPEELPHFPMTLHRGGYPDGS
jgi:hypothetical protein